MKNRYKLIVATHLLLVKDGKILLMKRHNTGYHDGDYSVPAGHIEGGETVRAAMAREAVEEIGVNILPKDLYFAHVMHRQPSNDTGSDDERADFFFSVSTYTGEPTIAEPEKCSELLWADIDNLPKNVIPYVRAAIEAFSENIMYSEFGW